jgi:hypothetical protein
MGEGMKKCMCCSCVVSRGLRRFRWLFTRREWAQIDTAMCHFIERLEELGMIDYDAQRGHETIINGRRYVPAGKRHVISERE